MAYEPPLPNAVNFDLKPSGSQAVTIPLPNAVNFDLANDPASGEDPVANAKFRNFTILLVI